MYANRKILSDTDSYVTPAKNKPNIEELSYIFHQICILDIFKYRVAISRYFDIPWVRIKYVKIITITSKNMSVG